MRILLISLGLFLFSCETSKERRDRFFALGTTQLETGNPESAIPLFDESLKEDPNYVLGLNNRGVAKFELGKKYEAILDYNQALVRSPKYLDALFNRAYAYESIGQFDKALKDVSIIKSIVNDSAFVYFYEGLVLTKMRAYDRAKTAFMRSDSIQPLNSETLINLATVSYFTDDLPRADSILTKVFELAPTDPNALNLAGLVQLKKGNFLASLVELNRALHEAPDEPYFINNRGYVYLQMDSLEAAIKDINRSILLEPKNGWAYRNKGIYLLQKREYQRALALFETAAKSEGFIDEILAYKGKALLALGRKDEACKAWKEGIENNEPGAHSLYAERCN